MMAKGREACSILLPLLQAVASKLPGEGAASSGNDIYKLDPPVKKETAPWRVEREHGCVWTHGASLRCLLGLACEPRSDIAGIILLATAWTK